MLEAACQKIKSWMDAELVTIPLSINICKQNIHRTDFLPRLIEIVMSDEIPPVLIELELNEEAVLFERSDSFGCVMEQLHRMGFPLTMDDCGASNFSSISLMRQLPLDAVKIPRKFLNGVLTRGGGSHGAGSPPLAWFAAAIKRDRRMPVPQAAWKQSSILFPVGCQNR